MSDEIGGLIGGVMAIFISILLVRAFYPVLVQVAGIGYGILFVVLVVVLIIAAIAGMAGSR